MRIDWRAIGWGVIADLVLSVFVAPVAIALLGVTRDDALALPLALVFGTVAVAVGAHVTASLATHDRSRQVLGFAVAMFVVGAGTMPFVDAPSWFVVASFALILPAAWLGEWLSRIAELCNNVR